MTYYEKDAARMRELWAGLTKKEKRQGALFIFATSMAFMAIAMYL